MFLVIRNGKVVAIESVEPPDGAYGDGAVIKEWEGKVPMIPRPQPDGTISEGDNDPTVTPSGRDARIVDALQALKVLNGRTVTSLTTAEYKILLLALLATHGWIDGSGQINLR